MLAKEKKTTGKTLATREWIGKSLVKKTRCTTCSDEARPYLLELLREINEAKAFKISVRAIHDRLSEVVSGFGDRVGFDAFRRHLEHEPTWHRAKRAKEGAKS